MYWTNNKMISPFQVYKAKEITRLWIWTTTKESTSKTTMKSFNVLKQAHILNSMTYATAWNESELSVAIQKLNLTNLGTNSIQNSKIRSPNFKLNKKNEVLFQLEQKNSWAKTLQMRTLMSIRSIQKRKWEERQKLRMLSNMKEAMKLLRCLVRNLLK